MNKSAAFLFPGQGAQYSGMSIDLLECESVKELFNIASEIFGTDIKDILMSDTDTLKRTDISQMAITAANLAAAEYLKYKGWFPSVCAGFSLGEYAALVCAGVLSADDCFELVKARGRAMQKVIDQLCNNSLLSDSNDGEETSSAPGMSAITGLAPAQIEELYNRMTEQGFKDVYIANINSPKHIVLSGTAAALTEAEKFFKNAGAKRAVRLPVAGPFHSPLMTDAVKDFLPVLEKINFRDPKIPVFSNVTGKKISSGEEAKKLSCLHITNPVLWLEVETAVAKTGIEVCFETGPGNVLSGLWKNSGSEIPVCAAGTAAEIENLAAV